MSVRSMLPYLANPQPTRNRKNRGPGTRQSSTGNIYENERTAGSHKRDPAVIHFRRVIIEHLPCYYHSSMRNLKGLCDLIESDCSNLGISFPIHAHLVQMHYCAKRIATDPSEFSPVPPRIAPLLIPWPWMYSAALASYLVMVRIRGASMVAASAPPQRPSG